MLGWGYAMARYLVTGGCGFIGSHLTNRLLNSGHDVVVVDDLSTGRRQNLPVTVNVIVEDVQNLTSIWEDIGHLDGCFHLAAVASVQKSIEAWHATHLVNLSAFVQLMALIAESSNPSIPIVYASSAAVFGDNPALPLTETDNTQPVSAYGADKLGCEHHARAGSLSRGLRTTGLRFFNVYGPRQDPASPYSGVISIFARRALDGRPITVFGDGEQSRDFVYVDDVVSALVAASQRHEEGAEVFNVCTGHQTTLNTLVSILDDTVPHALEVKYADPKPGDIRHSLGDQSKLESGLGIVADTDFATGLKYTLQWMISEKAPEA